MKKKLIIFLMACLTSVATWAVKADPTPITITQPDGTKLTIRLNGDEDLHWYSTTDGVLLVQDNMTYYVAKVNADGSLTATTTLAHEAPTFRNRKGIDCSTKQRDFPQAGSHHQTTSHDATFRQRSECQPCYQQKILPSHGKSQGIGVAG